MLPSRRLILLFAFILVDVLAIAAGSFYVFTMGLPRLPDDLSQLELQAGLTIYADSGELLYTFNRSVGRVGLADVSPHFINAIIATEDVDFYNHRGISLKGIAGALWQNLWAGGKVRGGSTLTQQIVKNLFLSRERTYTRKVKEILLAVQLESFFRRTYGKAAKQKLLELYMNGTFFGTSAYGVEDAARTYFDKPASGLTISEAAMLAGLPNAPSTYNPIGGDSTAARSRAEHVMRRMASEGHITAKQLSAALSEPLHVRQDRLPQNRTPYFVETIKSEIVNRWGQSALYYGGLVVHTTLDLAMQQAAESAVAEGLASLDQLLEFKPYGNATQAERKDYVQGALVSIDPATGRVKAVVGGRDIFVSYYNRATTAKRQPGSGFKPFVYLAAFASGSVTPISLFLDEPRSYVLDSGVWEPRNYGDSYLGLTTAAWGLVNSANATTAQIIQQIGPRRVVEAAAALGITTEIPPYPSIALGAAEVTPLELAAAYATLANYGVRVAPTFITRVSDLAGRELYRHQVVQTPAVDPADAYLVTRLLRNVIDIGTGRSVRRLGFTHPAAGKTGTTNDNTDAWFTGFTPDLVTSVWIGFDRRDVGKLVQKSTGAQITGGRGAAPIWTRYMKEVTAGRPPSNFWIPDGITEVVLDARTGLPPESISPLNEDIVPITIALRSNQSPNSVDTVRAFLAHTLPDSLIPAPHP